MAPRSTGSATLRFGFVAIPVKLYTATDEEPSLGFNLLHAKCGSRVKQQYVCLVDGEKVEGCGLVKGYEVAKDQFVTFTPAELEALEQAPSPAIEIAEFVPLAEIDPLHYGKGHHLAPAPGAERAYALFGEALLRTRKAGLSRWAKGGSQRFVMVRADAGGRLVLQQLLRAEQVRSGDELVTPEPVRVPELELAIELVERRSSAFRADAYPDEVRARTLERIQEKADGGEIVAAPAPANEPQIIDLLEALKASLQAGRRGPKRAERAPRAPSAGRSRAAQKK